MAITYEEYKKYESQQDALIILMGAFLVGIAAYYAYVTGLLLFAIVVALGIVLGWKMLSDILYAIRIRREK